MPTLTDRSRILAQQSCPRKRWLGYHYGGLGLTPSKTSLPLAEGTHVHGGLAKLLSGASEDEAAGFARAAYLEEAAVATGILGVQDDHVAYTVQEQAALAEALVRVYAKRALPKLLEEFTILSVEEEFPPFELGPGAPQLMTRLDGLLLRKEDQEQYVLSFKTYGGNNLALAIEEARIDLQGLTEPEAVRCAGRGDPFGVKMEWIMKGQWASEDWDPEEGSNSLSRGPKRKFQQTHLVRPYSKGFGAARDWAWKFWTTCKAEHTVVWKNGSKHPCPGGKRHSLGDSWSKVAVWEAMPMKEWIDMLHSGGVQPEAGDPLEGIIQQPVPIYRRLDETEHRLRQIAEQEHDVEGKVWRIEAAQSRYSDHPHYVVEQLDRLFPQHDKSCFQYKQKCHFYGMCHEGKLETNLEDPFSLGFKYREPHHEPERLVQIQMKGVQE